MNVNKWLDEMKEIQENIQDFLDNEDEENFENLKTILSNQKIFDDKHKLRSVLHLLLKIANNHYRTTNFFNKIDQILLLFKDKIKFFYSNTEIFDIFKSNKRILLLLIEEKIMTMDKYIVNQITTDEKFVYSDYPKYFKPEIEPFIKEKWFNSSAYCSLIFWKLPDFFYENRKIGENENLICKLIQKDSVEDFVAHINRTSTSLRSTIESSIYETNSFLIKKQLDSQEISLIEYAAFYGSIQIFQYLKFNDVLLPSSLWPYSIHGRNPDLIHLLEEENVKPIDDKIDKCIEESIKCFYNDLVNYFVTNFTNYSVDNLKHNLKYYNFALIQNGSINHNSLYNLCKYNHIEFVKLLLKQKKINVNIKEIFYLKN